MTFVKGQSGNPKGRPKGSFTNLTRLLKEKLQDVPDGKKESYAELLIKSILHKALIEKDHQSQKLIINYVDGLPRQSIDNNVTVNNLADYLKQSPDTVKQRDQE